jgi:hypothetical protein
MLWLYDCDPGTGNRLSRIALPVLNVAGGSAISYAIMRGTTADETASNGDLLALTETLPAGDLAIGYTTLAGQPTIVVAA